MEPERWSFNVRWSYWRLYWGQPWGARGWTPTLRTWQIGPIRLTRYYQPVRLEDAS